MQSPITDFNCNNLIGRTQQDERKKVFAQAMKGVYSAAITKIKFVSGSTDLSTDVVPPLVYRRFYYNENGDVIKRISFDQDGNIEMKEESQYNKEGKILSSKFIRVDNIIREEYEYDDNGHLVKYTLINPRSSSDKFEINELDANGRLIKTINYGLLRAPEYISTYIYSGESDENYSFKHVTKSDGTLLMTFYFTYGEHEGQFFTTGIYGFYLEPDEIKKIIKDDEDWESKSAFRSVWEYNNGKPVSFIRDEQIQQIHLDLGYIASDKRITTDRSTMVYKVFDGNNYLEKIIEWQTRFMEPWKELKEYKYYDEADKQVYPPVPEEGHAAPKKKNK